MEDIVDRLAPTSRRVFLALRARIQEGDLTPGSKLPNHLELAAQYRVSPVTMRQVLAHLEDAGLVSRQQGRGTFVQAPSEPAILIVDDEAAGRELLREYVVDGGYVALEAANPAEGIRTLRSRQDVALVISDVRMPDKRDGLEFIRAVRHTWPALPLAAVTAHAEDLADLLGTPDCPVLIVPKPVRSRQIDEVLRLAAPRGRR